jgi:hypothetical protein
VTRTAKKHIFVSYSRRDRHIVEPIVDILRSTPSDVFLDVDSIEPGDRWPERLQRALNKASVIFLFWSSRSATSDAVKQEWLIALAQRKTIIPVLLDSTPLPPELAEFQWIDFRGFLSAALHAKFRMPRRWIQFLLRSVIAAAAAISVLAFVSILGAHEWVVTIIAVTFTILASAMSLRDLTRKAAPAPTPPRPPWHEMADILRQHVPDA